MDKNLNVQHLHKNCRTCLDELIANKHDADKLPKEVFQIFKQITGFRKNEKLLYPKCICDSCYENIKNFSELKRKTSKNQQILLNLVDSYIQKFVKESVMENETEVEKEISQQSKEYQDITNEKNMEGMEKIEACDISQNNHFEHLFLQIEIKEEMNDSNTYICNVPDTLSLTNSQEICVKTSSSNNIENELDINNSNFPDTSSLTNSQEPNVNTSTSSNNIEDEDIICKICNSTHSTIALLETHMKIHKEAQPFPCKLCESGFDKKSHYNRHMKECHAETPNENGCDFENRKRLTRFKAPEADRTNKPNLFPNDINKKKDTVTVHDKSTDDDISGKSVTNNITCKFCQEIYFSVSALQLHMRLHKEKHQYECTKCEQSFKSKYRLKKHARELHPDKPLEADPNHYYLKHMLPEKSLKAKKNSFVCEDCGRVFRCMARLRDHSFSHRPAEDRPFKCEVCAKTFVFKGSYDDHMLRHAGIKNYECTHCGIKKATKSDLRTHIRTHLNNNTYTCPICAKVFNRIEKLRIHNRVVHQGIRRYKCLHCGQAFGKSDNLKHHVMRHTGERPHKCQICDRSFIQAVGLRSHMKTHGQ